MQEREGRRARSCRACSGTSPGFYAPAVPALSLGRGLRWGVRRASPAGSASVSSAAGAVARCGALLFPIDHPLHVALIDRRKLVLDGVEDGLVLLPSRFAGSLTRFALFFTVGVAHVIERIREPLAAVGEFLLRVRRQGPRSLGISCRR